MYRTSTVKFWNSKFIIHYIFLEFHVILEKRQTSQDLMYLDNNFAQSVGYSSTD